MRKSRSALLSQAVSAAQRRLGGRGVRIGMATGASPRCPGVMRSAIGRPQPSTTACIFVDRPPLDRPIASASAPLFRQRLIGALLQWCCRSCGCPDPSFAPRLQTVVAICLWQTSDGIGCRRSLEPIAGWTILPSATGSQDMDDPADAPAVVSAMSAGLVGRKQRSNHSPLPITEPEFSRHHPNLPSSPE